MNRISKTILAIIIIFTMMIGTSNFSFAEETFDYTLMVYMNGSDLESDGYAATDDLLEMIQGSISSNVAVIVQTGGTRDWHTNEYGLPEVMPRMTQRWRITDTEMILLESTSFENIGKSETLESFLIYGQSNYPADNYGIILWNHGSGPIYGFGADEHFGYDGLDMIEMEDAFEGAYLQTGNKLDMVGFDACLMGSIEVAEMLMPFADYLIASEELEPGHGWDYEAVVDAISQGKDSTNLGIAIADGFLEQSQEQRTARTITLSVVDLSQIGNVMISLNSLFEQMNLDLADNEMAKDILRARLGAESYGEGTTGNDSSDMVDILDFTGLLPLRYESHDTALTAAIESAVVYNINSDFKPNASGLSIYMPAEGLSQMDYAEYVYDNMAFSTAYNAFLGGFIDHIQAGGAVGLNISPELSQIDGSNYQQIDDSLDVSNLDADDYSFYMTIDPEQLELVDEISTVFAFVDEVDDIVYLSKDKIGPNSIQSDGTVVGKTMDYWAYFEGYYAALYYMGHDEMGYIYYYIPIMINDEDYDLIIMFSNEFPDGTVLGARPYNLVQNDVTVFNRDLVQLQAGDEIGIIYEYDTISYGSYVYMDWYLHDTFYFDGQINFEWDVIPDGVFAYAFEVKDIYQNEYYTDWILYEYYDTHLVTVPNYEIFLWDVLELASVNTASDTSSPSLDYQWYQEGMALPSSWAESYIDDAYELGLTTDASLDGFTDDITRGEFADLVINMYETATGSQVVLTVSDVFTDINTENILKAYQLGIITGYPDGSFGANNLITRQELITMFHRALLAMDSSVAANNYPQLTYADTDDIAGFAIKASEFMVAEGLISGTGGNNLSPLGTATKEQALKIVLGVYNYFID